MSDRPSRPGRYAIFPARGDDDPKTSGERRARAREQGWTRPDDWEAFDRDELTPVRPVPSLKPSSDPPPLPEYQDVPPSMARAVHRARECAKRDTEDLVSRVVDQVDAKMSRRFWAAIGLLAIPVVLAAVSGGINAQKTDEAAAADARMRQAMLRVVDRVEANSNDIGNLEKEIAVINVRNGWSPAQMSRDFEAEAETAEAAAEDEGP